MFVAVFMQCLSLIRGPSRATGGHQTTPDSWVLPFAFLFLHRPRDTTVNTSAAGRGGSIEIDNSRRTGVDKTSPSTLGFRAVDVVDMRNGRRLYYDVVFVRGKISMESTNDLNDFDHLAGR